jgi:hypothetical protein
VHFLLEIFVYSPTYFGLTTIFKDNIDIAGILPQQLHIQSNKKVTEIKYTDIVTDTVKPDYAGHP